MAYRLLINGSDFLVPPIQTLMYVICNVSKYTDVYMC